MAKAVRAEAKRRGVKFPRVRIESDARIALEGAFSGGPGIIVIAGTGSIVFGKARSGSVHRSGGWGRIIGDEGSGYAVGRELFRAVAAHMDDRGPKTALTSMVARDFGLKTQPDIIRALYKEGFDVASGAPLVTRAAAKGDRVAKQILDAAAADLVRVIVPVAKKLGPGKKKSAIPLVFVGSLMTQKNPFSASVGKILVKECPQVSIHRPDAPPVHGAALMALHER